MERESKVIKQLPQTTTSTIELYIKLRKNTQNISLDNLYNNTGDGISIFIRGTTMEQKGWASTKYNITFIQP